MEFDQDLFKFFLKFKKKKKLKEIESLKEKRHACDLVTILDSLTLFASAIFRRAVEIKETDDFPYISGKKIFLPKFIGTEDSYFLNEEFYRIIILHLYAINKKCPNVYGTSLYEDLLIIKEITSECQAMLSIEFSNYIDSYKALTKDFAHEDFFTIDTSKEKILKNDLSGFNRLILWGKLPQKTSIIETDDVAPVTREALPEGKTEKENKKSKKINKVNFDENKENIGQDVFHHFEKVETLEEYKGIQRELDGADDMDAHADALDELNLEEVVRSLKQTQSLYKTDIDMGFEVTDLNIESTPGHSIYKYDEWDEKKHTYKKEWCQVFFEKKQVEKKPENSPRENSLLNKLLEREAEVIKIKKKLLQLSSEVHIKKRLLDGRSLDIDNYVRGFSQIKAKKNSDGRFYKEITKRHRDMCTLMLVDSSLSADSWILNKRVLDVCLESLLIFGEALQTLNDPICVAGFSSNTRNNCKFIEWKSFDEDWGAFKDKVDHLHPEGYTRIGPAIRHAKYLLGKRKEKQKILVIFTDGRPTDYDRYEGSYGLSDVFKAISECEHENIICFAIAVDPGAKQFLPKLFGKGNFQILLDSKNLPEILSKLYIKISGLKK